MAGQAGWLAVLVALGLLWPTGSRAQSRQGVPAPPASTPREYNPDPTTCRPELMQAAYRQQLGAYQEESPAVVAQLQRLQRDLTVSSINRCITSGLMSKEQAQALAESLGLDR